VGTLAPRPSLIVAALVSAALLLGPGASRALAAPCDPPVTNPVACENSKPGNPASEWDISGAGSPSIAGFATNISVDQGQIVTFKVDTAASAYHLDIYRMGYYGGMGARKVATVQPLVVFPELQPSCLTNATTGLVDCGNWTVSASWTVPLDAVSGIYFAKLVRDDGTPGSNHIVFVVRDDDGRSDVLFQTSDTTWQAYNTYGGNSLYAGGPGTNPGRAYKVSYNRPITTRGTSPEDWVFNAEYPMVRFLERNGYNVSYFTGVDSDRLGAQIRDHRVFLSVGHDEYWSAAQRANVEAARAAGVHLGFFSGNESFWKTRWENSIDGSSTPHRTLVSYKETHANAKIDPLSGTWTGTWRDPRFSPPADGGRPENALTGQIFMVNGATTAIQVPSADGKMRFWRNTSVATLAAGATATLAGGTLGYEWDEELDNGARPAGAFRLSSTTVTGAPVLQDYGSTYSSATADHHMTLYRGTGGGLVFGDGTVQWSWGLDANHDRGSGAADVRMQQATVNLLADMGVQPGTLMTGLVAGAPSADATAPTSTITAPVNGGTVTPNSTVTVSGTATDAGGGVVGGVEVSTDGGTTWHAATGRGSWTYSWRTGSSGTATIKSRAADDSANLESPSAGVTATIGSPQNASCPCSIWGSTGTPAKAAETTDNAALEVGVKFRAQVDGKVTALRFYKGSTNAGTHVGHLWTRTGTLLASATFTNETATGWQQVALSSPVQITAGTTYVASYYAPRGNYAVDEDFFTGRGVDSPPLRALADGEDGGNGLYGYGALGTFPAGTYRSENYWIDVVFDTNGPDTTPPTVTSVLPAAGATGVAPAVNVTATFNEAMDAASITTTTVQLRDPANTLVPGAVTYDSATRTATLNPTATLNDATTYTATVQGGANGVKDSAGNPLANDRTWTFTTSSPPGPPPDEGPGGPILVISRSASPFSRYYAEILRAEGLNEFTVKDMTTVTAATLASYDAVIVGDIGQTAAQAKMLSDWVNGGGDLIAMRPDKQLAGLLGLTDVGMTLANAYLKVDTSRAPGAGIVDQTIQFHGTADRYALNGATSVAALYSTTSAATSAPAVTVRSVGSNGGTAAAFTFDLARSVVYTRQGNPAWAGDERDGQAPIRSDDLFFGAKSGDVQPDWIDLSKAAIPQADEQQRLLVNLIGTTTADKKPLPRFWYLPRGLKAAVIMTGDDHGQGGTGGRFDAYKATSPAGCAVAQWECIRSSSYVYPNTPLSNAAAAAYTADGFEVGVHINTNCADWTAATLDGFFTTQLSDWTAAYPSLPPPSTQRTHCIAWSDWASTPRVELTHGMRLDGSYYYWPPEWVANQPGFFTGSGLPMRFADLDGTMIDVYQATTQMTDESGQSYPFTIDTLLDRALGPTGYYGIFNANMHTDVVNSPGSDAIVASAKARGVPVVSGRQMLTWLDGRNGSAFAAIGWSNDTLSFRVAEAVGATGLRGMLPTSFAGKALKTITRDGSAIAVTREAIKGVGYAFFSAIGGQYAATYEADTTAPVISAVAAAPAPDGTATVTWTTDEAADSRVDFGTSPSALTQSASDATFATAHSVKLTGLSQGTAYYYRVRSVDPSGNATTSPAAADAPASFTTPVTAFPAATVIETGTARAGNAASLTADDDNFFQVTSTTSGTRTTSWYGSFTNVPGASTNLKVTYIGKNSRSCTQVVAAWRWTDSTWQQLDSRAVSTTELAVTDLIPPGAASGYVNATTGEVRVRVRCTTSANFFTSGELMKLTYSKP
jgi:hypothetical protein